MTSFGALPPSLKAVEPYLKRAQEFDASKPIIAYYCRVYALQQAIAIRDTSDVTAQTFVKDLLLRCESQRATLPPAPSGSHHDEFRAFTLYVFQETVATYRDGNATKVLAANFVKTGHLIDVCSYFEPLTDDFLLMRKRCKGWALAIAKDVRAGRQPMPPPELVKEKAELDDAEAELDRQLSRGETPTGQSASRSAGSSAAVHGASGFSNHAESSGQPLPPAPPLEEYGVNAQFLVPTPELSSGWDPSKDGPPSVASSSSYSTSRKERPLSPPQSTRGNDYYSNAGASGYLSPPPLPSMADAEPVGPPPSRPAPAPPVAHPPPLSALRSAPTTPPAPKYVATPPRAVSPVARTVARGPAKTPTFQEISQAQKKAKFAVSSLDFKDVNSAIKELEEALELLRGS